MKKNKDITKIKDKNVIEVKGKVIKALPNAMFEVEIENGQIVLCTISGKIRINRIRIEVFDEVYIGISIYQLDRGRILYRI